MTSMRDSTDPVAMDWDKLRIFHAAADAGSFTHAGEQLNMSQSAVSRQVSGLERDLKVTLFHRHARGLMLTEQGEVLFRAVHDVFTRLQSAATLIADNNSKPTGDLRVSAAVALGSAWLTPRLAEFVEQYPEISLQLILDDEELDLSMREADVAIWFREPSQSDLVRRPLFSVRFHAYASAGYIAKYGHPRKPEDLDRHRLLTYSGPASSPVSEINWLAHLGREDGNPRGSTLRINNIFALKQAVLAGVGVAVLPDYLVEDGAGFVQVLENVELGEFQTYFVYPEELRNAKKVQVFRDFIVSKARKWQF
jgi:DNA-binding transcriptional LysR family regulator